MELSNISLQEWQLIHAVQLGFPLTPRPYQAIAERIGWTEAEVMTVLSRLKERGVIKRMGVVVRHHELGYQSNAMVVWDVPNDAVADVARQLTRFDFISLCYQRRRCLPDWPFNLYCMIHGHERQEVLRKIEQLVQHGQLAEIPRQVLFSRRRFKQCGAHYEIPEQVCQLSY